MPDARICPECRVSLPPGAPQGLCPRCLMGAAVSSTAAHSPKQAAPAEDAENGWPIDLEGFRREVVELGLMEDEDLQTFVSIASVDVAALARILVRARKLTAYQAGAIAQGKGRGLIIGRYLVLEKRGRGGMGIVFKAKDRRTNRVVALKILPPSFGRDAEAVQRFRREFELAARLKHPNVVAAVDADEDRGVQFLTMEYIEGNDLDDLVSAVGPLPIKLAVHCAIQAARGLEAAHAAGIVHRDIKPSNLMLDASGVVRVLDLGLARVMDGAGPIGKAAGGSLTVTGAYMGTVDFVAPEQADDSKKANHLSDTYSLGCTLYFLLTGRPPFEGDTMLKRLMAHQSRPAPTLHAARPDVPPSLERAYQAMMSKRPEDRPQSMTAVIAALEACRSSDDEAKEARATLMNFAETFMKRAQPRTGRRPADASIFAQPKKSTGVQIDPSVNLEDLLMDYREEIHHGPLAEEKLPPKPPRLAAAPRPRRQKSSVPYGLIGLLLGVVIAGYALWPKTAKVAPSAPAAPSPVKVSSSEIAAPLTVAPAFRPLFSGTDLRGWTIDSGRGDSWKIEGGNLVTTPPSNWRNGGFLLSDGEVSDFHLRFEFQPSPDANSGVTFRAQPGEFLGRLAHPLQIELLGRDGPTIKNGSFIWSTKISVDEMLPPARLIGTLPSDSWSKAEIEVRGDSLRATINGVVVLAQDLGKLAARPGANPALSRRSGHIGFQSHTGTVRFRNIEIQEPANGDDPSALPVASSPVKPSSRLVFADDFDNPRSGWASETAEEAALAADHHRGIVDGMYRQDGNAPGWWHWTCPKQVPAAFSCEVVARVFGDNPQASGAVMIQVDNGRFGLQVKLDNQGRVRVLKSNPLATGEPYHNGLNAAANDAIKTGPLAFNTINFQVADQKCEIRVNGVLVLDPFDVTWEQKPSNLQLGVGCDVPNVRVEYGRIEIREILPSR